MDQSNFLLKKFLVVLILISLLGFYVWGHNVGNSRLILLLGLSHTVQIFIDIGLVVILFSIAGAIGHALLVRIHTNEMSTAEKILLDAAVGLGIISLFAVTMGLIGLFNPIMWGALLICGIVLRKPLINWVRSVFSLCSFSEQSSTKGQCVALVFIVGLVILALIIALAPPTTWDAINYHLVIPQRYIKEGAIRQQLDNHFFGFPQNIEMLFGLLMMFGTDRAPAVLHFALGCLSLCAVYGIVERHTSQKAALFSILVLVGSYSLWLLLSYAYVDLAVMFYCLAGMIIIYQWILTKEVHWLILAGIVGGFSLGVKYTAAPILLAECLVILLAVPKKVVRHTLMFGGFVLISFSPWLIKNWVLYGNPVYPYLFGGVNWDAIRAISFAGSGGGFTRNELWYHLLFFPVSATVFGIDRREPYAFTLNVFLLTFPFFLPFVWQQLSEKSRKLLHVALPMTIIYLIFWMIMASFTGIGAQTRLMLGILPLAAILCGLVIQGMEHWPKEPLNVPFMVHSLLVVSLVLGSYNNVFHFVSTHSLDYHVGIMDEDAYLEQNLDIYYKAMKKLSDLPEKSRVLFLWEPKTYYCPETITCIGDILFDHWAHPLLTGSTPEEVLTQWENDYDYFLFYDHAEAGKELGYSLWLINHQFATEVNSLFSEEFFPLVDVVWTDNIAYTLYQFAP